MVVVIFEVEPLPGKAGQYFDFAAALRPELEKIEGFISVERFESVSNRGKYVSISFWRDEEAIHRWRAHIGHQHAQQQGHSAIFKEYRIRVATVVRDYSMFDRQEAPAKAEPMWGDVVMV
jgi:heme-degrading monooxygenase HmoA